MPGGFSERELDYILDRASFNRNYSKVLRHRVQRKTKNLAVDLKLAIENDPTLYSEVIEELRLLLNKINKEIWSQPPIFWGIRTMKK